ncbi:phage head spike fiber domain-containing protein [Aeromonas caviae]
MAGVWKRDGTVAVTNGNKKVTGTGTTFADTKNGVAKGHLFCITSGTSVDFYEVDYVVSNTELYLVQAYRGVTATGKAYEIITTFSDSVPEFARRLTATLSAYQQQSDAFQALLTSTATTVEVTAPDGTKQTLIPWKRVTSEGEGQATRAKTEADKAAASAALAGDIVAASALPLPDVWAPLSDSLRLFTGYGREVKVGDDVIARMLTFSRSTTKTYTNRNGVLTTAAVNEPTFDLWGLQLDGQSQNKVVQSEILPRALQAGSYTVTTSVVQGYNLRSCVYTSGDDAVVIDAYATLQAPNGTCSFVFNAATIVGGWSCYFSDIDSYQVFWPKNSAAYAYEDLGNGLIRVSRVLKGTSASVLHFRCGAVAGSRVDIGCFQLEELPFASSYIPTNGAAVTRAADLLTLQNPLNIPVGAGDMTVAIEVRRNQSIALSVYPRVFNVSDATWLIGDSTRFAIRGGTVEQGILVKNAPGAIETVVYRIKGDQITVRCGSASASVTRTGAILPNSAVTNIGSGPAGTQNLFGHVRNLRVWRRALTDDQMKAIT